MPADQDVVEHAHMLEQRQVLEGAPDPQLGAVARAAPGDVAALIENAPLLGAGSGRKCSSPCEVLPAPFGPMIENSSPFCDTAS